MKPQDTTDGHSTELAERIRHRYEQQERLQSAQLAYLSEKLKIVGAECSETIGELRRRIDQLEGNASGMLSLASFAKMKGLPVRYLRNLIADGKLSALPVAPNRYKIDVAMANRELRLLMLKGCLWRQAHEQPDRRRVDFAA